MDLEALAQTLRAQAAANGTLVLNSKVLPTTDLADLRIAWALPKDQDLVIQGVTKGDIPDPSDGLLRIRAGQANLLKQSGVSMELTFSLADAVIQAVIVAKMPTGWTFKSSFTSLNFFPFSQLAPVNAFFAYSTIKQAVAWPDESSVTLALEKGQNFASHIHLNGFTVVGKLLRDLIGHKDKAFKFYGPFSPKKRGSLPFGTIKALIAEGHEFQIGPLMLDSPAVAVRIQPGNPLDVIPRIDLAILAKLKTVEFSVGIPPTTKGTLQLAATPVGPSATIEQIIESLPGGSDFRAFIPPPLKEAFDSVGLDGFSMIVALPDEVTHFKLSIGATRPWKIIPGVLTLGALQLVINVTGRKGAREERVSVAASAHFLPKIFSGEFVFFLELVKKTKWELGQISGSFNGGVRLGDLVSGLIGGGKSTAPAVLNDISFSNFGMTVTPDTGTKGYTYQFSGTVETTFPIAGASLVAALVVSVVKRPSDYDVQLLGNLVVGEEIFNLELDLAKEGAQLTASWKSVGAPLEFEDIAHAFGFVKVPQIPPRLDLGLVSATFSYDFKKKILILTAQSKTYGDAVFLVDGSARGGSVFAFGIKVPLAVTFADVPVVGKKIPDAEHLGILDAGVWVLSSSLSKDEAIELNALIHKNPRSAAGPFLPEQDITARVLLSATLELGPAGQQAVELALGGPSGSGGPDQPAVLIADIEPKALAPAAGSGKVTPPATNPDGAKWIDLKKTIGPLSLQRIGLKYSDSELYFMVDLGFSAGGLTIDLSGLSVSSPLTDFSPHFHLSGLEIEYKSSAFELAGEFLNVQPPPPEMVFEYAGAALLKAGAFELSALGAYGRTIQKQTSLFVFVVVEYPLGGPPFFFVTGGAAGFGYNRSLIIPDVSEIPNFPLVAAAENPSAVFPDKSNQQNSLSQALGVMEKYIKPEAGEYWLAAGVRFSTFEMLSSFALISVAFGNEVEIALIGESTLSLPPDPTGENPDNPKIANVELALEVKIEPTAGDFKAAAVLTQNSWLFAKACRLTGGFAFYIWYGGPHAGDFVITLGGYNPHYKVPSWYPNEPQLGIDWQLSSVVTIKGGSYFALTPHAIMAGGGLEVLFQTGPLRAWLKAFADFLIEWQPFHYEIDIGINIGVSFTFRLFGARITIKVEIGASLYLWGPEFGGQATVHLWIVSFTIPFGKQVKTPPALTFEEFNQAILPKTADPKSSTAEDMAFGAAADDEPKRQIFIHGNISAGVIESPSSNGNLTMPIVSAKALQIEITASWPAKTLMAGTATLYTFEPELYAKPMHGTKPIGGCLTVKVEYEGNDHTDFFDLTPILNNAPTALWGKWDKDGPSLNPAHGSTIAGVPFGIRVRARAEKDLDPSDPLPLKNFSGHLETVCFSWPQYVFANEINGSALDPITATIDAPKVAAVRSAVREALTKAASLPSSVEISPTLSHHPDDVFLAEPQVAHLGQVPRGSESEGAQSDGK